MKAAIACVVGTRPEAIKMAPVILALRDSQWAATRVIATAQHREMLDEALSLFGIVPDLDLDIMQARQALPELTARLLAGLGRAFAEAPPEAVIAQGDTATVLTAALAAYYQRVPFCHVEAGLRTGTLDDPFPEEMNRVLAGRLARLHFAPTEQARLNLLAEGVPAERVHVTGNTVIDALQDVARRRLALRLELPQDRRIVLLTAHRRENFGAPLQEVFGAVRTLADRHPDLHFVYPVHPNPNVADPARSLLADHAGITLCAPLDYGQLVALLQRAWLVLTDSGGLQEEAPALGKPVLVLRRATERPEAVAAGVARMVGTRGSDVVAAVEALLGDPAAYATMARGSSPYGDGHAAPRIVGHLERFLRP